MRRAFNALPTAAQMPWPSEPVATSTKGSFGVGWPSRSDPICRSVSSSRRSNAPASAQAAYRIGAACPFDNTNRSLSGLAGSFGSKRISAKKSAAIRSAIEQQLVGCPLPASEVERSESMRSRVAMFFRAGISAARSRGMAGRSLSRRVVTRVCDGAPFAERDAVDGSLDASVDDTGRHALEKPRGIGAIIGRGRDHGGAAVLRIVVERCKPAQYARRIAREHEVRLHARSV